MTDQPSNIIIYNTADGKASVALYARDGKIWLNQQQMAELFATSKQAVSHHIVNILKEKELLETAVVKQYLTTAADGKNYNVVFYSLEMILAVGFRVRGVRGTQFRQWANQHLSEYLVKGFTMDDERLKNPDGRPDYFDELLERIRDIRASEKRFYQKLRDLFKLSSDYEAREKATQMFFAETQNKLLYAVTHNTAAEIIMSRANAELPNMGLTTWKGSIVRKGDIIIAKNYLQAEEIDKLNRIVNLFLESAELRVKERKDLTLDFWRENVKGLLTFQGLEVLQGNGHVSNQEMEDYVRHVYEKYDSRRKSYEAQLADEEDMKLLKDLESEIKKKQEDMTPTGTHFNYYHICHRKLWLFANGINMEHVSDTVYDGKLIHEGSYPQRPERYEEIAVEGIKVDYYDAKRRVIHEIKRSDKVEKAHEWQVKYYIYVFERNGIEGCTGLLEYPTMRQTLPVVLTDDDREEIRKMEQEIVCIIESDTCPPFVKKRLCKSCSYYDFCYTSEPDEE